ncbi:MAG: DNA methyltransferase [Phormidium sp.]
MTLLQYSEDKNQPTHQEEHDKRPETYTGIYAMHKYWSKKPYNLVANYIKKYSEPGNIILDPFCGSGVTVIESIRLGRCAIGNDINPVAVLLTKMGLKHIDIQAIKNEFEVLKKKVIAEIDELYRTDCPKCKSVNAIATHTIWSGDTPIEVWVQCEQCKTKKSIKPSSQKDKDAAIKPLLAPLWYPTTELIENPRINAKAGYRVCDLFTPRSISALSILLSAIHQIQNKDARSVLEFCFSAALPQASNMVFVIRRRGKLNGKTSQGRAEVGSWVIGYWVPTEHFEIHVWRCFENRFRRILKGKQEVNKVIPITASECVSFEKFKQTKLGYLISQGTATNLNIPSDSVDYIFTDPPHGNRVPYLELSLMWNSWLNLYSDWDNEIVVSEARLRRKDISDYQKRLEISFFEMWRVLKEGKYISVAFNSLDDKTWLSLLNAMLKAGFEVVEIKPLEYSARSVVQDSRKNALKTDFVITCTKKKACEKTELIFDDSEKQIEALIGNYISKCNKGIETYKILNYVLIQGIYSGKLFRVSNILSCIENLTTLSGSTWRIGEL